MSTVSCVLRRFLGPTAQFRLHVDKQFHFGCTHPPPPFSLSEMYAPFLWLSFFPPLLAETRSFLSRSHRLCFLSVASRGLTPPLIGPRPRIPAVLCRLLLLYGEAFPSGFSGSNEFLLCHLKNILILPISAILPNSRIRLVMSTPLA